MDSEIITLGECFGPPVIDMPTTQDIYECVKTEEFEVEKFNSLLMAVVTYLDAHKVEYADKQLPWAEIVGGEG